MQAGSPDRVERRLAAILAADVVGYSRLMEADEVGTARLLREQRAAGDPLVAHHSGRVVKTTGDGVLIEFASVVGAVQCAVSLQKLLAERNAGVPTEARMDWRIGVHLGDILIDGEDILGDGVNLAARLEGIAEPGGICISEDVFRQVRGKIETEFFDSGEQTLKNIARPVRVYRTLPGSAAVSSVPTATDLPDTPSIAVLPFQNMSGDPEQEYFVDGMVEEIITALSRIRWLFVIARNSTFTYKNRYINVKQVAGDLGVRYLLEGSVRKAGNNVRITAQLIDTTSEAHIWSERFDGVLDDVFELQDRVASGVAGCIEPQLQLAEIDRAKRKQPQNLTAYDLYLRARGEFHEHSDRGSRQAIDLAKQALAIDPAYAPAAALIGECWVTRVSQGWGHTTSADREEIVRLAKQAIRSGRDDPDALWMAAISLSVFSDEHALADMAVKRALVLNPNSAPAWNASGFICLKQNKNNEAIDAQKRAIRLSPLDPLGGYFSSVLAQSYLGTNQYEEALEWAERCLCEFPTSISAIRTITIANVQLGRMEDARRTCARWLQLHPNATVAVCKGALKHLPPEIQAVRIDSLRQAGLPEA